MGSLPTTPIAFPSASTSPSRSRASSLCDQGVITSQPIRQANMTTSPYPETRGGGATNSVASRIRGGGYGILVESWRGCMGSCCCCCCCEEEGNNDFEPASTTQKETHGPGQGNLEQGTGSNDVPPSSGAQKQVAGEQDGQGSGQARIEDESFRSPSQPRDSATGGPVQDYSRSEGGGVIDDAPQSSPRISGIEQPARNENAEKR